MGSFNYFTDFQTKQPMLNYTLGKGELLNKEYLAALLAQRMPVVPHAQPNPKLVQYNLSGYISLAQKLKSGILTNKQAASYLLQIVDNLYTCRSNNITGGYLIPDLEFMFVRDDSLYFIIIPSNKVPVEQTLNRVFQQFAMGWQPESATGTTLKGELMEIAIAETSEVLQRLVTFIDVMADKYALRPLTVHNTRETTGSQYSAPNLAAMKEMAIQNEFIPEQDDIMETESELVQVSGLDIYPEPEVVTEPKEVAPLLQDVGSGTQQKVKDMPLTLEEVLDNEDFTTLTLSDDTTILTGIEFPALEHDQESIQPDITKVRLKTNTGVEVILRQQGEYIIGSSLNTDIHIQAPTVSRNHAVLKVDGSKVYLKDMASKNGTFVDNLRQQPDVYVDITSAEGIRLAKVTIDLEVR